MLVPHPPSMMGLDCTVQGTTSCLWSRWFWGKLQRKQGLRRPQEDLGADSPTWLLVQWDFGMFSSQHTASVDHVNVSTVLVVVWISAILIGVQWFLILICWYMMWNIVLCAYLSFSVSSLKCLLRSLPACLVSRVRLGDPSEQPTRLLCPWAFTGKNTGMGCHILLQLRSLPIF